MTGGGNRWRRAGCVAAVVAVLGVLLWWSGRAPRSSARRPQVPAASHVAAEAKAAPVVSPRDSPIAEGAHGAEERQICGGAWVKFDANGGVEGELPDNAAEVANVRESTLARLRADSDEYARTVAVWFGGGDDAALVDRARGTRDARVYAFAFRSCRRPVGVEGSVCGLLSAAQWARLDPGNAAPWLYAFADAAARNDPAGVDEALFQIGRSERLAMDLFRPLLPLLDAAPSGDVSLLATLGVATEAVGRIMATSSAPLMSVLTACRGSALADANRSQVCGRVADVLAERSDDLLTRSIGSRLVTELTGSSDRQALHRAEMEAWGVALFPASPVVDALGCKTFRRLHDRLREQALFGEVGAMRRWVDASGLTPKELLDRSRRVEAGLAAAAASAAAAEPQPAALPTSETPAATKP